MMVAIKAHFDGRAIIPEVPVELPRGQTFIVHIEAVPNQARDEAALKSLIVPSDPEAARQLIEDPESALENL